MRQVVFMLSSLLFILAILVTRGHCDDCDPSEIEKYFEEDPDAWKLVTDFLSVFYLVYHSKNHKFDESHSCLWALRQRIDTHRKMATYRFEYTAQDLKTVSGTVNVKVQKMDKAYQRANIFLVAGPTVDSNQAANKITQPTKKQGEKRSEQTYQLLFTDYKFCAVLKSSFLGVQVWVSEDYLKKHNDVPYGCSLAYDLMADQNKTLAYDWRKCKVFTHTEL
uniref:Putative salivary lipocalin n=1 Tax=Ixodes ricinus TaxID=34613 RepID=A0A0K8RGP8_IXORI